MAASDAKPFPIKNTAYRVYFPILDADGDLVSGATGLDSEASLDGGTFADCTNEATEIATSSGIYYLDLTTTEMNTDCTVIQVKTSSSGAKTTVLTLYPVDTGDIDVDVTAFGGTAGTFSGGRAEANTTHWGGTAVASAVVSANTIQISGDSGAADNAESFFDGTGYAGTNNVIPTVTTTTNVTTVNGLASGVITATSIASDAITAAKIADGAIDANTFATGAITASAIAADAIGASELATDAVAEIADAVWDELLSGHSGAGSAGLALSTASSGGVDPSVLADAVWDEALSGHTTSGTAGKTLADILVDTAEIGSAGAGLTALASAANLATLTGYVDTEVATIVTQTSAASIRSAVGLASANLDTQLATIDTNVDFILDDTGTSGVIVASLAAGSITASVIATGAIDADALAADAATEIATAVLTTQMTESYAADGTAPTLTQAMMLTQQSLHEFAISGTTRTVKKLDGTTTAATFTLDSSTAPTSTTRAS